RRRVDAACGREDQLFSRGAPQRCDHRQDFGPGVVDAPRRTARRIVDEDTLAAMLEAGLVVFGKGGSAILAHRLAAADCQKRADNPQAADGGFRTAKRNHDRSPRAIGRGRMWTATRQVVLQAEMRILASYSLCRGTMSALRGGQ